ncbi:MAG: hypothetical protein M3176_07715 [Chloroflexota bacterium]|nr:hypothetical protein [Chloroflexota bacterium]
MSTDVRSYPLFISVFLFLSIWQSCPSFANDSEAPRISEGERGVSVICGPGSSRWRQRIGQFIRWRTGRARKWQRAALGNAAFTAAWVTGAALPTEQAITEALAPTTGRG